MTDKQRLAALAEGNRVRIENSRLLRELREMRPDIARFAAAALIRQPMKREGALRVYQLLCAIPKIGQSAAYRMLVAARVSPSARVRGLTDDQREDLARMLTIEDTKRAERSRPDSPARRANRVLKHRTEADRQADALEQGEADWHARQTAVRALRERFPHLHRPDVIVDVVAPILQRRARPAIENGDAA